MVVVYQIENSYHQKKSNSYYASFISVDDTNIISLKVHPGTNQSWSTSNLWDVKILPVSLDQVINPLSPSSDVQHQFSPNNI